MWGTASTYLRMNTTSCIGPEGLHWITASLWLLSFLINSLPLCYLSRSRVSSILRESGPHVPSYEPLGSPCQQWSSLWATPFLWHTKRWDVRLLKFNHTEIIFNSNLSGIAWWCCLCNTESMLFFFFLWLICLLFSILQRTSTFEVSHPSHLSSQPIIVCHQCLGQVQDTLRGPAAETEIKG